MAMEEEAGRDRLQTGQGVKLREGEEKVVTRAERGINMHVLARCCELPSQML